MTTYNQADILEILDAASQDGCFEDEAEAFFGKLGAEFHALIEGTWVQTYLEELGLDLVCPPWKQKQDVETAQIQEWYAQYPEMAVEWEKSVCKAYLEGAYDGELITKYRTDYELDYGDGARGDNGRVSYATVKVVYFVVEGKEWHTCDMPYTYLDWVKQWISTKVRKAEEAVELAVYQEKKVTAASLAGTYGEVEVTFSGNVLSASITFTVKVFKPYGKELEEEYTVFKEFPLCTSLEKVLEVIRSKADTKTKEKEAKYAENKAYYTATQEKLAEGQKLYDQLTVAGKADGFRMNNGTLEKLSTWKAKGGVRSNWCHIDAISTAKLALGVKSKPVIKRRNT